MARSIASIARVRIVLAESSSSPRESLTACSDTPGSYERARREAIPEVAKREKAGPLLR